MSSDFERLLRRAGEALPGPDEAVTRRARERALGALGGRRRFRRRSALALAATLVAAVGAGVGIGALVAPSGTAAPRAAGLGFLPERGWNVLQSATPATRTTPAQAIAANVALSPEDDVDGLPYSTLLTLPPDGVVIVATFTVRGLDRYHDANFPARKLPLRLRGLALAFQFGAQVRPQRPLGQYQLKAAVNGHNVDVNVYFGTPRPPPAHLAAAQRQLDRLVVAPDPVTIFSRPSVARGDGVPVTLFGSVDNGKAGEVVDIQAKDCGQQFFRGVAGATTGEGGSWSTGYFPGITTTLRAVWNGHASAQITVQQRPRVELRPPTPGGAKRFRVSIVAKAQFWRREVVVQRFDRRLGAWVKVKSVVLTEQAGAGVFVNTWATFRVTVPRGTLIRAVFPRAQARPCYLAGFSNLLRT